MAAIALAFVIAVNAEGRVPHEERASEAPASALVIQSSTTPNPAMSRRTTRRLGDVIIVEQDGARLTDIDVRDIQSVLAPKGAWWLHASIRNAATTGASGPEWLLGVDACMQPEVVTATFRRGHCVAVTKLPVEGWWRAGALDEFAQLGVAGENLALQQPARIIRFGNAARVSDDTLIEVMTLTRRKAVSVETPRRTSDIQPYPINRISIVNGDLIRVELRHAELPIYQTITFERSGDEWQVIQII